ncbi:M1 family metallopeptidase [Candidatus Saccharibacteria bacterium]|nr:M1 family metallopeptidase [Candidatus Saccharibacteria bacterium]
MKRNVARLYTQFQPDDYSLQIELYEAAMRFSGQVKITGKKVGRPSQRLTFHSNGLKVTSGKVTVRDKRGERELTVKRINHQKSLHEVRIHTVEMVYPGQYTVEMSFEAPITNGMTGIYPCYWKDAEGQEQKLFATQFESHHAREAFPCIDEPEAKAVFDFTLITQDGVQVLGNTPAATQQRVKRQESRDKSTDQGIQTTDYRLQTTFEPTPRMSTYLLAFVTGDMHRKTAKTKSGVNVNVWATAAQPANSLDFALDAATRSIEYFEDYFGVPYPLAKADHVALPDFSSGAMENWGLITYRERVLLDYPETTSQSTREYIALVVAHETSHQWFGNLVTMRWWDDLWLNESFANMMEYQAVDSMFPDWHVWHSFIASEGLSAFRRDATYGVQPVHTDVHHPDEISTLFDPSIVYAKGGRLLYMMKNYIGEEAFRSGLSDYFKKHEYGNTCGDDLWAALSTSSGKDVGAFMTPWLARSGFPVVHVTQEGSAVQLTQEHFLDDRTKADETRIWPVPTFASVPSVAAICDSTQLDLTLPNSSPLLLNSGARGHYLVQYRAVTTKHYIEELIKSKTLTEPDRLMLLSNSAMLSRAGYQSYRETLDLLDAYTDEDSEPVWDIIGLVAGEVRRFVDVDESLEPAIKTLSRELIQTQYTRLGWQEAPGESTADTKLRSLIIGFGVYGEDEAIVDRARELFAAYQKDESAVSSELRALVMSVPVKEGDQKAIDFLLQLHDSTQNSELKSDTCAALTATRETAVAAKLLARLKEGKLIKPQDVDRWLIYLLRNRYTRDVAWQWMVDEWAWLQKTFENDKSYDYLPRYAASCVSTAEYQQKYHDLFQSKLDQPMLKRNIEIGFEEIANRLAWLTRDLKSVKTYFASR